MRKVTQILTTAVFAVILAGGMLLHLALPDGETSTSERRKLAQLPELSWEDLVSGSYMADLETYLLDQFPMRDGFRTVKSIWSYYILGQKDNNGVFLTDGTVSKLDAELDEKQLQLFITKMNSLREKHFPDSNVWSAVIPDKNYYLTDGSNYPRLDYETLFSSVEQGLPWAAHVDLTGALSADRYYTTDSHWRQEQLQPVVQALDDAMGLELPELSSYTGTTLEGFHGVYHGQAALPLPAEDLTYLESPVTQAATVTGPELQGVQPIYAPEKFESMDGYNVFLHGPQAVLTLENPLAETDRELIIFRDSYGSSLAPLLLPGYKTVTLVDIRYVNSLFLDKFVDFHGQDVLILYSTTMINSAAVLQ